MGVAEIIIDIVEFFGRPPSLGNCDARAGNGVSIVGAFPTGSHPPIRYPLARLAGSRHRDADAFRRFLLSPTGHAILARYGFSAP